MVLACGLSMPVSMMVVHSSRLARWPVKSRITRSSSRSFIWPWPMTMRASGTSFSSFSRMLSMVSTSLCRKYTWPPRFSSRSTASRMMPSEKRLTKVLIARRFCGAVAITEKSRRPSMRHRQRARDRRRGQRQHIDLGAQGLQRFLLAHAETVFLVDDDEAEAVEFDVLADQLVRADDDVDLAFGQFLQGLRRFLGGLEAGDFGDLAPASRRSGRRRSGNAVRRAGWSGTARRPACRRPPRRRRRAARLRSCRSRHRRRPGDPSACRSACRR